MGYFVLDMVKVFEKVNNIEVLYKLVDCCLGDIVICYLNLKKVWEEFGWKI